MIFGKIKKQIKELNSDTKNPVHSAKASLLKKKLMIAAGILTVIGYGGAFACSPWLLDSMTSITNFTYRDPNMMIKVMIQTAIWPFIIVLLFLYYCVNWLQMFFTCTQTCCSKASSTNS